MVFFPNHQLAAGNNNAAGLSAIETILAGYGSINNLFPSVPPKTWGTYDPGQLQIRAGGLSTFSGYPTLPWPFGFIIWAQIEGLKTNFCSGGYSGLVTVKTRTDTHGTYANFNAVINLPKLSDFNERQIKRTGIENYVIRFTRMVAL